METTVTAESGAEEATANAVVLATPTTTGGGKITPVAEQDEDEADDSDDSSDSVLLESIQKRQNYIFSRDLMSVFNLTEATNNTGNNTNNNNTTTTLTMTTSTSQTQPKQLQQQPSRATKIYSNDLNTETDNLPSFSESISCAPAAVATTETTSLYNTYHNQPTTTMTAMSAATQSSSSSSTSKQQAVKIRKELAEKKKHQQPSLLREEIKEEELSASAAVTTTAPTTSSANSVNNVTAPSVHNITFNEDSQPKSSHLPSLSSSAAVPNENKAKSSNDELVLIDFDQFETGN